MVRGILTADTTSIGAGTSKTQLNGANNVTMPIWARSLDTVHGWIGEGTVITAAQPSIVKFHLESTDATVMPYKWYPMVLPSVLLGAQIYNPTTPPIEEYPVFCPLHGGEDFQLYGEAQVAPTAALYAGCALVVSDNKIDRQRFAEVGTYTSTGTTASTDVPGTAYTLNGSERIVEVQAQVVNTTVVIAKPVQGRIKLSSGDFKTAVPLQFSFAPIGSVLGASAVPYNNGVLRYTVDVPTQISCTLQDNAYFETVNSTAGGFVTGVLFQKINFQ